MRATGAIGLGVGVTRYVLVVAVELVDAHLRLDLFLVVPERHEVRDAHHPPVRDQGRVFDGARAAVNQELLWRYRLDAHPAVLGLADRAGFADVHVWALFATSMPQWALTNINVARLDPRIVNSSLAG